jgi:hypothetical protein
MNRTILLKKDPEELGGPKKKIVRALIRLGADAVPVEFVRLKKACASVAPHILRAHVRDLRDLKVVTLRKAKVA